MTARSARHGRDVTVHVVYCNYYKFCLVIWADKVYAPLPHSFTLRERLPEVWEVCQTRMLTKVGHECRGHEQTKIWKMTKL